MLHTRAFVDTGNSNSNMLHAIDPRDASPTHLSAFDRKKRLERTGRTNNRGSARVARDLQRSAVDDDNASDSDSDSAVFDRQFDASDDGDSDAYDDDSSDDCSDSDTDDSDSPALSQFVVGVANTTIDAANMNDKNDDGDNDDERELREQFYRHQQRERASQSSQTTPPASARSLNTLLPTDNDSDASLDAFLTRGLELTLPSTAPPAPVFVPTQQQRCRRPSSAVLPDGVLHVFVYRASQLAFRQHFASMYERHGLHVRCYLAWRRACVSKPSESRRNSSGNMTNPVWRAEHDHAPNLMRGHFAVALGDRNAPDSVPANTELVLEIVCGILVVSTTKIPLLELFGNNRASNSDTIDTIDSLDDVVDNKTCKNNKNSKTNKNTAGIVSVPQQWYTLQGNNAGMLEVTLEFMPASVFDEDDDDKEEESEEVGEGESAVDNNNVDDNALREFISDDDNDNDAQQQEPEHPDDADADADADVLRRHSNARAKRFECSHALASLAALCASDAPSLDVVVSNNGKTTMYIPAQCQSPPTSTTSTLDLQLQQQQRRRSSASSAASSSTGPQTPGASPQTASPLLVPQSDDREANEQLLELFLHGISSDEPEHVTPQLSPSPSSATLRIGVDPQQQTIDQELELRLAQFASAFNDTAPSPAMNNNNNNNNNNNARFVESDDDSATDLLSFNDLIHDMETALDAAARVPKQQQQQQQLQQQLQLQQQPFAWQRTPAARVAPTPQHELLHQRKKHSNNRQRGGSNSNNVDDDELSSVQEAPSKGVVLFDLSTIPERLRNGFERSTSDEHATATRRNQQTAQAAAAAAAAGNRRRSLPVNSLTPIPHDRHVRRPQQSQQPPHSAPTNSTSRHRREPQAPQAQTQRTRERSDAQQQQREQRNSLQSLADLHARGKDAEDAKRSRRRTAQPKELLPLRTAAQAPSTRRRGSGNSSSTNAHVRNGIILRVGRFINVGNVPGVVRYVGPTHFATGTWIGIELCENKGKHNGVVKGVEYFRCADKHGIFIRADRLET